MEWSKRSGARTTELKLALALDSALVTVRVSGEGSVPMTTVIVRLVRRLAY
jgi:hypothetical protein